MKANEMFSRQTEAVLRLKSIENIDNTWGDKFKASAEVCRFVRIYVLVLRGKGVPAATRLKALGYLIVRIYDMLSGYSNTFIGQNVLGIHRYTFEELTDDRITNVLIF